MKTSGYSDGKILAILKQAENGMPAPEPYREYGKQCNLLQEAQRVRWHQRSTDEADRVACARKPAVQGGDSPGVHQGKSKAISAA